MWIRSRDICDQIRKLSEIAPNIFMFLSSHILLGDPSQKLYTRKNRCLFARRPVKFREVNPTSTKVIGVNTLNFKQKFKCSSLNLFGGPDPD